MCLLCNKYFDVDVLKPDYLYYHSINENNYFFRELFSPDNVSKRFDECKLEFKNCRLKKDHNFLLHYQQTGGRGNQQLPLNVLRRDPITYFSINYHQHKDFYDFFDEGAVDSFFNYVYERFASGKDFKMQGCVELGNYQQTETEELLNIRVWLTNVFIGRYFNQYIRGEMKKDILKQVIINGARGSSWIFKRFNKLQVIVTDRMSFKNIMSGQYFFSACNKKTHGIHQF